MKYISKSTTVLLLLVCLLTATHTYAQNFRYECRFYFHLGKYDIDESLNNNYATIDSILHKLRDLKKAGNASDLQLHITSYASLESSDQFNYELATNRTNSLTNHLKKFVLLNDVPIVTDPNIFDWQTLINMTKTSECPYKEEALRIMAEPEFEAGMNVRKAKLEKLGGGVTYQYMRQRIFPLMRNSALTITANLPVAAPEPEPVPEPVPMPKERKKIHAALSSNLLYDAVTLGNLGLDVYLGNHISIGANWMYTWWKADDHNWYWRGYGGDAHADYWFDKENLWHGHHVGIYGQMLTFDVAFGNPGYQGPKWLYGGGVQYGYSLGIAKRLTLDFGIGVGYLGGKVYEYTSSNVRDKYIYQKTHNLNWIGPTNLKVSLMWNFDL